MAVRQHLYALQAERLVTYQEAQKIWVTNLAAHPGGESSVSDGYAELTSALPSPLKRLARQVGWRLESQQIEALMVCK